MPVPLPNLDDRSFDDLVEEGKRLIPNQAPSWTDHNPSDPGITFIELFAFITEMLLYRADRVSEANKQAFVKLLRGDPDYRIEQPIEEEIRLAVLDLRSEQRVISPGDFRSLAESVSGVGRTHCLPHRNVLSSPLNEAPAHISVLIVPSETSQGGYDLRLVSVDSTDRLPNEGRNLVIVALVATDLHIRIFDSNGRKDIDKAENELIRGATLTDLKKRLDPLPDVSRLSQEQKQNFVCDATSVAGYTPKPPLATEELKELIRKYLAPRCLLTTRLHVAAPDYLWFAVNIVVYVFADQNENTIGCRIKDRLAAHFHPLSGGSDGRGWPFGQSIYISDLYAFLDSVEGVDYVAPNGQQPELTGIPTGREIREGRIIGLRLEPHELVWFDRGKSTITVKRHTTVIPGGVT